MTHTTTPDSTKATLSDPGGVRGIQARWIIECELKLESATRLGGRSGGPVDIPVLRDARSGCPLLTGSTLAGALRSCLTDQIVGYWIVEPQHEKTDEDRVLKRQFHQISQLFGGSRGDDLGSQSPLIVFDSYGSLPTKQDSLLSLRERESFRGAKADDLPQKPVEIRDSVKIDASRGTAEDHKKFDGELLPAGTTFPLRFELLVPSPTDNDSKDPPPPSEAELLSLLLAALNGLSGEIALGARRSRGMGRLSVSKWKAKRFDFDKPQGWLEWLMSDAEHPLKSAQQFSTAQVACGMQSELARNPEPVTDQRNRVRITATLTFSAGLLVRSPTRQADAPDVMHLKSAGQSVLPGTSLAGVLRNRALRIARLIGNSGDAANEFVDGLFGPELSGTHDRDFKSRASRLRISEDFVTGGKRQRPTRIRIDRFTQGVFESALFDEEPDCGGRVTVTFELRGPEPGQLGLLLLLVRDLLDSDLAVGGTTSVGRGVARGTAELEIITGADEQQRIALTANSNSPLTGTDLETVNAEIRDLRERLKQLADGGAA